MAKCNLLGRGEARSLKKLEKAKEKINILKVSLSSYLSPLKYLQSQSCLICNLTGGGMDVGSMFL